MPIWLASSSRSVSIPANVVIQPSDTAGFRGYVLGSADAPVEVIEYADYECPACQQFEVVQFPAVKRQLIDTGNRYGIPTMAVTGVGESMSVTTNVVMSRPSTAAKSWLLVIDGRNATVTSAAPLARRSSGL